MAKTTGSTPAFSKQEKKAAKIAARASKKERRGQIWQAFQLQRKEDKRLLPYMILCLIGTAVVVTGIALLLGAPWWGGLVFSVPWWR
jgi:Flp pilus assembly protein TadB